MKKSIFVALFTVFAAHGNILDACKHKWGEDYSMIKHCVNTQTGAKKYVDAVPSDIIKKACQIKWGEDYSMIKYCIDSQKKAKDIVSSSHADEGIVSRCKQKWGNDYNMIKYCVETQSKAKESLGI